MEIHVKVKVKSHEEMEDCFNFDEILNVRWMEYVGNNIYKVIIRLPECKINIRGVTTLKRIKEKVLDACATYYTIKNMVTFVNGTTRIIYASNEFWSNEYATICARQQKTKVVSIERLEG